MPDLKNLTAQIRCLLLKISLLLYLQFHLLLQKLVSPQTTQRLSLKIVCSNRTIWYMYRIYIEIKSN